MAAATLLPSPVQGVLAGLPDGAVIRFRQAFRRGGQDYGYAAIQAAGKWYLTGGGRPLDLDAMARRLDGKSGPPPATELQVICTEGWA